MIERAFWIVNMAVMVAVVLLAGVAIASVASFNVAQPVVAWLAAER